MDFISLAIGVAGSIIGLIGLYLSFVKYNNRKIEAMVAAYVSSQISETKDYFMDTLERHTSEANREIDDIRSYIEQNFASFKELLSNNKSAQELKIQAIELKLQSIETNMVSREDLSEMRSDIKLLVERINNVGESLKEWHKFEYRE